MTKKETIKMEYIIRKYNIIHEFDNFIGKPMGVLQRYGSKAEVEEDY